MFCPNCGDIRGNVKLLDPKKNTYRCPTCGHVFIYILRNKLENKLGPGLEDIWMDDNEKEKKPHAQ